MGSVVYKKDDRIDGQAYASFYLRLEDRASVSSRIEYTLTDWLSEVGGIAGSLMAIFGMISTVFSYQIFIATVLENLFFVKTNIYNAKEKPKQNLER